MPKEREEEMEVVTESDSLDEPNLSCLIQLLHRPWVVWHCISAVENRAQGLVGEAMAVGAAADPHKHSMEDVAVAENGVEDDHAGTYPSVLEDNHVAFRYRGDHGSYCGQKKDLVDDNCNGAFRFA